MLQTQQPVLRRFWNPVMPLDMLDDGPKPFRLFGVDIVVWKDSQGRVSALEDRCCHRTAKLSVGTIKQDERGDSLACAYHGWQYGLDGGCVKIPQQPELSAQMCSARAKVKRYYAEARYGYVWVCLEEPLAGIPDFPEEELPDHRRIMQFYKPWKCSGLRLMENSFDNAHFSFVHQASFGQSHQPVPASIKLTPTDFGFIFETKAPVNNPDIQKKILRTDDDETIRHMRNRWYLPFIRKLHITYPNGLVHAIVTCATPIDDDAIQVCQWAYRNDTEEQAPAADIIAFDRQVTNEDQMVLESTDFDAPLGLGTGEERHMPSDQPGMMMRKRLIELLKAHGEQEARLPGRKGAPMEAAQAAA